MTTILVVEDQVSLRKVIVDTLHFDGYHVLEAPNGRVGLSMARKHLPELILCDVMMPEMNGFDMLQELRKDPETGAIPFLFLTARGDRESMRQGMELGADDFLTKPFSVIELIGAIRARLQRHSAVTGKFEKEADDLRGHLILMLPHELRTPLTSIIGYSEFMMTEAESMPTKAMADLAANIYRSGQRLYRLVENYLAYALTEILRKDPSRLEDVRRVTTKNPGSAIEETAMDVARQHTRESDLVLDIVDVDALQIFDENLVKIVFELVDNAFKFSSPGMSVQVNATRQDNEYVIDISNQGRGMTSEQIAAIGAYVQFERKFHEQQGSGLGLTVAMRLAELYAGRIDVESAPGEKTCIHVFLPLAKS